MPSRPANDRPAFLRRRRCQGGCCVIASGLLAFWPPGSLHERRIEGRLPRRAVSFPDRGSLLPGQDAFSRVGTLNGQATGRHSPEQHQGGTGVAASRDATTPGRHRGRQSSTREAPVSRLPWTQRHQEGTGVVRTTAAGQRCRRPVAATAGPSGRSVDQEPARPDARRPERVAQARVWHQKVAVGFVEEQEGVAARQQWAGAEGLGPARTAASSLASSCASPMSRRALDNGNGLCLSDLGNSALPGNQLQFATCRAPDTGLVPLGRSSQSARLTASPPLRRLPLRCGDFPSIRAESCRVYGICRDGNVG